MAESLRNASRARSLELGSRVRSSFSKRLSDAYRRATCEVVNVMSTSGAAFATRALASRSSVPPTSNSTGVPVLAVNGWATTRSMVSFQLPPQMLITSGSAARTAPGATMRTSSSDDETSARPIIRLETAGQQQDDEDQDQQADAAAGIVAPPRAVRLQRQRPEQDQDQDDEQHGAHGVPL